MAEIRALWKQQREKERAVTAKCDAAATVIWTRAKDGDRWSLVRRSAGDFLTTNVNGPFVHAEVHDNAVAAALARIYGVECKFVVGDEGRGWFDISVPRPADLSDD